MPQKHISALTLITLLITLFFGLRPKGYDFSNNVQLLKERDGVHFGEYGLAYAYLDKALIEDKIPNTSSFSIEIAIKPESFKKTGFKILLSIHAGNDQEQLLIGQWGSRLVVMNGNDYAHRKKTKRITTQISPTPLKEVLVSITTGTAGTSLYIDGQLVKTNPDLKLQFPQGNQPNITLGNSVYGNQSWTGDVYALSLFGYELSPETIKSHSDAWLSDTNFSAVKKDKPILLYLFEKNEGKEVSDFGTARRSLVIPASMHLLKKEILVHPLKGVERLKGFVLDALFNLVGFIPLGFLFSFQFVELGGFVKKHTIPITVVLCVSISLMIEIFQGWMPSRSSQLLDLILNTTGASIGVIICKTWFSVSSTKLDSR